MPQVGIAGNIQEVYGSQVWANWFALGPNARNLKTHSIFSDFNSPASPWDGFWHSIVGGAGASVYPYTAVTYPGRIGYLVYNTGTTAAGYALTTSFGYAGQYWGVVFGTAQWTFETDIYIDQLSTAAEEYSLNIGFGDVPNANQVDGVYFRYDRLTSTNWLACTANNSVRTSTDTGIAVNASGWVRLKIVVNYAGTRADFYCNSVLVATNILNIPTARSTGIISAIVKSAGLTNVYFMQDWIWLHYDLTASR